MPPVEPSQNGGLENPVIASDEKALQPTHDTILVAEDNVVNQKIITLLLEKLGLRAHVVGNGREAVDAVSKNIYPIVLMDCHMPEMDGFEATRAIRRMEMNSGRHTPIIAVTALAMVGDRERCIEAGMDDYISKPIDKERLKSKLNHWMQKEFVFHNQKLAERYFSSNLIGGYRTDPLDLSELEVFYGSPDEVQEVLGLFVQTAERNLKELRAAIDERSDFIVGRLAHELKGSSASVGAKEMSLLCLQLEQEAGQQNWVSAPRTMVSIETCFKRIQEFLKTAFASSLRSQS